MEKPQATCSCKTASQLPSLYPAAARCQGFTLKQTRRNRRGKLGTKVEDSPLSLLVSTFLCSRLYVLTSFCSTLCRKAKEPGKATMQSSDCIQIVLFVQDLCGSRLPPSSRELKFLLENPCDQFDSKATA